MMPTTTTNPQSEDAPRAAVIVPPGGGIAHRLASGPQTIKLSPTQAEGGFDVLEIEAIPGGGPPLHVHRDFDEAFYILDGTITLRIGTDVHVLLPRTFANVPAGTVPTWKNKGDTIARFLQLSVPGGMEGLVAELASAGRPLTPEEFAAVADRHGTTIVGPPL